MKPEPATGPAPAAYTRSALGSGILVGSLWLAFVLNYCDRQVIFSIFPILRSQLHFTNAQLGLISTVFSFVYGIGSPVAGEIGDKFSKRRIVIVSLLLWSLLTTLTGLASSVVLMLCCRGVIGISESLFMPAAVSLAGNAYPPASRSRAVGVLKTAQIFGVVAGGWFGGIMADRGLWRESFYVLGAVGLAYAIPCHLGLKRGAGAVYAETKNSGSLLAMSELVKIPTYLVLSIVFAMESFGVWLLYAWLPTFFREKFSLGLGDAALLSTLYLQGGTFFGMIGGGWMADRLFHRWRSARFLLIGIGLWVCAPFYHLLGHCDSLLATKLAAVVLGFGTGMVMANTFAAGFEVVPADTRASSVGLLNVFAAIGAGLGPLLAGMWKQSLGIGAMMTVAGGVCAVGGVLMLAGVKIWFGRDYARVHEAPGEPSAVAPV